MNKTINKHHKKWKGENEHEFGKFHVNYDDNV